MRIKDLKGRKCFITGAASGIGRATAIAMAELGAELFLTDINKKLLEEVVSVIEKKGGTVSLWAAFDISDYSEVKKFSDTIHEKHGHMDIVMNIAGIAKWGTVERFPVEKWEQVISINLMGPIYVMERFMPEMVKAGNGGHLVNVSSTAGIFGYPWHAAYSGSKGGLNSISEVLRYDLQKHNIGVTLVCPGAVDTPIKHTVEVVGLNQEHKAYKKFLSRFEKHAVSPERAAYLIIKAIRKNRFLIFTSLDVALLYWCKRKLFFVYHIIMKTANKIFDRVAEKAGN